MGKLPRPPLGLKPRWLHEEHKLEMTDYQRIAYDLHRYYAIKSAVVRYVIAGKDVPKEWMNEMDEIVNNVLTRQN